MPYYAMRTFGGPVLMNDTVGMMVTVNENPVTSLSGSLRIESAIGRRSQASYALYTDNSTHFQQYQQTTIYDQDTYLVFSGYITTPKEVKPGLQPSLLHSISCADQHFLADKRVIATSYVNKTCGFIFQDIVNKYLLSEGITVGFIYDGQTPSPTLYPSLTLYPGGNVGLIPSATFAYCTAAEAFNALVTAASSSGVPYYWQIDQSKRIWFVPYTSIVNSVDVDGTQIVDRSASVSRQNATYRNTQYIVGGTQQTVQQTETRKGDGNTQAWPMSFAFSTVPTVKVNSVTKTVGIKGVDSGKDFYWAKGDPILAQDSGATKLVSTDTLQVTYYGQFPSVTISQNSAQVSLEASIDGSSGIIEEVESDDTLTSVSDALAEAGRFLSRYATQGIQLQFTTLQTGFVQGQLINVDLPDFGLSGAQFLIESVSAADSDGVNIWYTVNAIQGPYDNTWVDFFGRLLSSKQVTNAINVGTTQSLTILQQFTATIIPTATLSTTVISCPLPTSTTYPSSVLYPC